MKNNIMKLLSALLTLCMLAGVFTAFITATAVTTYAADSSDEEEEIVGFDSATFLKTRYANAEDKLRTMSVVTDTGKVDQYLDPIYTYAPYRTYKNYELYVQQETGEVAVKNTATGQVLFTNPYDAAPLTIDSSGKTVQDPHPNAKSKLPEMFSQLILTFENISDGKQTTLDAEGAYLCGRLLFEFIREHPEPLTAVGGMTLGSVKA